MVKPLFGSEGRGIVRVSDFELARRTFRTLERLGAVLYVQRSIRTRATTFACSSWATASLGAFRRLAAEGDWRTNVALGGRPERCELGPKAERLALDAARAVGARMAGVDLVPDLDRDELVVLEVNAVPGWRALAHVTGIDVAEAILADLRDAGAMTPHDALSPGRLAQIACLLEVSARKPGNVHRFRGFRRRRLPRLRPERRGHRRSARSRPEPRRGRGRAPGGRGDPAIVAHRIRTSA